MPAPDGNETNWMQLTERLDGALAGLIDRQFLLVSVKGSDYYLQATREDDRLYVESVSNGYLLPDDRLGDRQVRLLLHLGWCPPGPCALHPPRAAHRHVNWWREWVAPAWPFVAASAATVTLRVVYGVGDAQDVTWKMADFASR